MWRWRQRPICVEAVVEVARGGGKGRFMWRLVCEGSDRGRPRRQRQRQIKVAQRQICMKLAWGGGYERDWSGGYETRP